jgi:hypothetical protein
VGGTTHPGTGAPSLPFASARADERVYRTRDCSLTPGSPAFELENPAAAVPLTQPAQSILMTISTDTDLPVRPGHAPARDPVCGMRPAPAARPDRRLRPKRFPAVKPGRLRVRYRCRSAHHGSLPWTQPNEKPRCPPAGASLVLDQSKSSESRCGVLVQAARILGTDAI